MMPTEFICMTVRQVAVHASNGGRSCIILVGSLAFMQLLRHTDLWSMGNFFLQSEIDVKKNCRITVGLTFSNFVGWSFFACSKCKTCHMEMRGL